MPPVRYFSAFLLLLVLAALPAAADEVSDQIAACERFEHGEPERSIELAETLLAGDLSRLERSRVLGCQAWALASLGRAAEARLAIEQQLDVIRQIDAPADRTRQLQRAASISYRSGAVEPALELVSQARELAEAEGLDDLMPAILGHLAIYQGDAGQLDRAIVNYHRALDLLAERGESGPRVPLAYNLGLAYRQAGRFQESFDTLEPLLPMLEAPGMEIRRASLLGMLGGLQLRLGQLERATELLDQSARLHRDLDNPAEYSALLRDRALLSVELGDAEAALAQVERALVEARRSGDQQSIIASLTALVDQLESHGEHEQALSYHRELLGRSQQTLREQLNSRLTETEARLGLQRQAQELEQLRQKQALQTLALEQQQWRTRVTRWAVLVLLLIAIGILVWQRHNNRRLDRISRTDSLTELPNRRALTAQLKPATSGGVSVLFLLDLDHFKQINDVHGHDSGDRALIATARLLKRFADDHGGLVGRWGGEEFAVQLDGQSDQTAAARAGELVQSVAAIEVNSIAGERISLSASVGFAPLDATRPNSGQERWEPALNCADQLLYRAKKAGRNGWFGVWPNEPGRIIEPLEMERQIESGECRLLQDPTARQLISPNPH